jgi:DNA-binding response OmpR family regulator
MQQMNERPRILLVDDELQLLRYLGDRLRRDGYDVALARSGRVALDRLDVSWPDIVILDLMIPDLDGETVASEIKRRADIPIIVLSAISSSESKVELIQSYAEDYVTKPFHYPELLARIKRVLRRLNERIPRQAVTLGPDLTLVLPRRQATVRGTTLSLSPTETRLLATLVANLGQPVSTEQLLSRVWSDDDANPAYVWVTVRRLRLKIEVDPDRPRYLLTSRGGGYRLMPAG